MYMRIVINAPGSRPAPSGDRGLVRRTGPFLASGAKPGPFAGLLAGRSGGTLLSASPRRARNRGHYQRTWLSEIASLDPLCANWVRTRLSSARPRSSGYHHTPSDRGAKEKTTTISAERRAADRNATIAESTSSGGRSGRQLPTTLDRAEVRSAYPVSIDVRGTTRFVPTKSQIHNRRQQQTDDHSNRETRQLFQKR